MEDRFTLVILDETNDESHSIMFSGSKTVRGVKEETFVITDIPVRSQVWTGWPAVAIDTMVSLVRLDVSFLTRG
jgi:hypothetical protein